MAGTNEYSQAWTDEPVKGSPRGIQRKGRAICQALIILDAIGAIAFIVMGIFIPSWLIITVNSDKYDAKSQPADPMFYSRQRGLIWTYVFSSSMIYFSNTFIFSYQIPIHFLIADKI